MSVLVLGFGNPGRLDDGLGPACASAVEQASLPNVCVDSNYQLVAEDALAVAQHQAVVFVDASTSGSTAFAWQRLHPARMIRFSTHSVRPADLLALADEMFGGAPPAFLLTIRGYEFNSFGEGLSAGAERNLQAAVEMLLGALGAPGNPLDALEEAVAGSSEPDAWHQEENNDGSSSGRPDERGAR